MLLRFSACARVCVRIRKRDWLTWWSPCRRRSKCCGERLRSRRLSPWRRPIGTLRRGPGRRRRSQRGTRVFRTPSPAARCSWTDWARPSTPDPPHQPLSGTTALRPNNWSQSTLDEGNVGQRELKPQPCKTTRRKAICIAVDLLRVDRPRSGIDSKNRGIGQMQTCCKAVMGRARQYSRGSFLSWSGFGRSCSFFFFFFFLLPKLCSGFALSATLNKSAFVGGFR